jgi:flavodoxin I
MIKVLLVFWPEKGNVDTVADKIVSRFNGATVKKISVIDVQKSDLGNYHNWIIGGSTVGAHVWEDADDSNRWFEFFKLIREIKPDHKVVTFYGLGDQILYPHHFVDGLGFFQQEFEACNFRIVGKWPVTGYDFYESAGVQDDYFFGLALDEDNQGELTEERISQWIESIRKEFQ